jgi:hypothetical protein
MNVNGNVGYVLLLTKCYVDLVISCWHGYQNVYNSWQKFVQLNSIPDLNVRIEDSIVRLDDSLVVSLH